MTELSAVRPVRYPVKPGDWVESRNLNGDVAKVKEVYRDRDKFVVDLYLFDRNGSKLPRQSPACGGPRSYEPACNFDNWVRIKKPDFPIVLQRFGNGDGTDTVRYASGAEILPNRDWVRPVKKGSGAGPIRRSANYDPNLEASSRRLAAERVRQVARQTTAPNTADELLAQAKTLDAAAAAIIAGNYIE